MTPCKDNSGIRQSKRKSDVNYMNSKYTNLPQKHYTARNARSERAKCQTTTSYLLLMKPGETAFVPIRKN